jgi:hypothetical protein
VFGGRSLLAAGCTLAVLIAVAGCGGTSSRSPPPSTAAGAPAAQTEAAPSPPPPPKLAPNRWREPREAEIHPHPGARVQHVIVHDVKRGTGPAVRPGDAVKMDYIEANWTSGHEFMRAWGGEPWPTAEVGLSPDAVMKGLIVGMTGMRVGGHRRILVPRRLSDVHDSDRVGNSYKEIVYYDVVLRAITSRDGRPFAGG